MQKRLISNRKYIKKKSLVVTSSIYAVIGIIGMLAPLSDIFPEDWNFFIKLLVSVLCSVAIFVGSVLYYSKKALNLEFVEVMDVGSGHHVYVTYGDIFSPDIVKKDTANPNQSPSHRNIGIAVNRCFDTTVDDDLIMASSLHG